jgi:flavin-dependent thymidylate synthase
VIDYEFVRSTHTTERQNLTTYHTNMVRPGACTVELVSAMTEPEQLIAKVTDGYAGVYSNDDRSEEQIKLSFADNMRTKLATPLEMLYMVFLVKYVSRAFTHQMVRTRLASYVQESMRFLGSKNEYNVLISATIGGKAEEIYSEAACGSVDAYENLLYLGVKSEDARGVLPTNILTAMFIGIPMSSLQKVYTQRMCCQAQAGEWQIMLRKMKVILATEYGTGKVADLLSAPYERGEPCGYRASFDRPCIWQKDGKHS